MNLVAARRMARSGRLYPSVILHGATSQARQAAALELARLLLCERPEEDLDGSCRHCHRIAWPGENERFHPDFQVLERDLKTATSVEATREFLLKAQVAPFEAGGQVFVVAAADSLSGEAANALLKTLEEPHLTSPRHFFLLTPSQADLLPTLRSRSLTVYLGAADRHAPQEVDSRAGAFSEALETFARSGASVDLLAAASALLGDGSDWKDPRDGAPWTLAAAAVRRAVDDAPSGVPAGELLALAADLLDGPRLRLRGLSAKRIVEGLVVERLAIG